MQSARERGTPARYGLRFLDDGTGGTLSEGLQEVSLEVQRSQVRRQSGHD